MPIDGRIGFVGVGAIGGPMAEHLLEQGAAVAVFARRSEVRERFVALGATAAGEVADVGVGATVVVLCPFADEQVRELALGDGGVIGSMAPGSVLVIHTTGSPATATALAEAGRARGVAVVDAPVSGTVADVVGGHITLLVGGDVEAVAACRPVLSAYAEPILHVGPVGAGQAVKLVNNTLLAANVRLMAEAERVAASFGIESATLAHALQHASGGSWVAGAVEAAGSVGQLAAAFGPFLRKDLATVTRVAQDMGVDLGLLLAVAMTGEPF